MHSLPFHTLQTQFLCRLGFVPSHDSGALQLSSAFICRWLSSLHVVFIRHIEVGGINSGDVDTINNWFCVVWLPLQWMKVAWRSWAGWECSTREPWCLTASTRRGGRGPAMRPAFSSMQAWWDRPAQRECCCSGAESPWGGISVVLHFIALPLGDLYHSRVLVCPLREAEAQACVNTWYCV